MITGELRSKKETLPNQTSTTSSSQPDRADDLAVEQLRKQLKTEDKPFAVAYLGYMSSDCATVGDYIDNLDDATAETLIWDSEPQYRFLLMKLKE